MASKEKALRLRPKLSHCIVVALVFMAIALIYVWFHIKITRLNYEIASEMSVRDSLMEENRRLKVERESLQSPSRIEKIARTKLGMYYPGKDQVVFVR